MNIPATPKPENPALLELVIGEVQTVLKTKLLWLTHAFGKSQRLSKLKEGKEYFYPSIHLQKGEYISVFPNKELGNFAFFQLADPQAIDFEPHNNNTIRVKYSLIFWFDLDTIFISSNDRNIEVVKAQILRVLTKQLFLKNGRLTVAQIFEMSENLYKGFSIKEIDSQYLMQPYGGLRFEGELTVKELC